MPDSAVLPKSFVPDEPEIVAPPQARKSEEPAFREWYGQYSKATGSSPNPDDPAHYYDYRGFWKEDRGRTPLSSGMHLPDKYKLPGHPTFSNESKYATPGTPAGRWEGERYVQPDNSPQILAEDPSLAGPALISASRIKPTPPVQEGAPPNFLGHGGRLERAVEYTAEQVPKVADVVARGLQPSSAIAAGRMVQPPTPEEITAAATEPLVKPSLLIGEGGPPDLGRELVRGLTQGVEGLSSPQNLSIVKGLGLLKSAASAAQSPAIRGAWNTASTALSAYFAKEMGTGAYEAGKSAYRAIEDGDYETAARQLGLGTVDALFAFMSAAHATGKTMEAGRSFKAGYEWGQRRRARVEEDQEQRRQAALARMRRETGPLRGEAPTRAGAAPPETPVEVDTVYDRAVVIAKSTPQFGRTRLKKELNLTDEQVSELLTRLERDGVAFRRDGPHGKVYWTSLPPRQQGPPPTPPPENLPPAFENEAGRYRYLANLGSQVRYQFVNQAGEVTEQSMPTADWAKVAGRSRAIDPALVQPPPPSLQPQIDDDIDIGEEAAEALQSPAVQRQIAEVSEDVIQPDDRLQSTAAVPEPPPMQVEPEPATSQRPPTEPEPKRTYDEIQAEIDAVEDSLQAQGIDVVKLHYPESKGPFPPGWNPMPENLAALYLERDAIQHSEDAQLASGLNERLAKVIPDHAARASFVAGVGEFDLPPSLRGTYQRESWRDIGRVANEALKLAMREHGAPDDVWGKLDAVLGGTPENPGVRLRMRGASGYEMPGPEIAARAQEILDALTEGQAPRIPVKTGYSTRSALAGGPITPAAEEFLQQPPRRPRPPRLRYGKRRNHSSRRRRRSWQDRRAESTTCCSSRNLPRASASASSIQSPAIPPESSWIRTLIRNSKFSFGRTTASSYGSGRWRLGRSARGQTPHPRSPKQPKPSSLRQKKRSTTTLPHKRTCRRRSPTKFARCRSGFLKRIWPMTAAKPIHTSRSNSASMVRIRLHFRSCSQTNLPSP
jgi:hypothetical protein